MNLSTSSSIFLIVAGLVPDNHGVVEEILAAWADLYDRLS